MSEPSPEAQSEGPVETRGRFGWVGTVAICLLILSAGAGVTIWIFSTEPKATRGGATKKTAMLVEVAEAERGSFRPEIMATGTVVPAQEIMLSPRVSGQIIDRAPEFTPGGFVEKGAVLLRIDPADFENVLEQRQSELRRAVAALEVEMGRQNVARQGYELLDEELSPENEALVLRVPQLNTARAAVESARAAVRQAELDLERTAIRAPFAAQVLERNVNVGSQVEAGSDLGHLVGVKTYWVEATVPLSKLARLTFPEDGDSSGSPVRLRNRSAWSEGVYRKGRLNRLVGTLEERTRMARVLVAVEDPLGRSETSTDDEPALLVGEFLEVLIEVREIPDVVRLDRDHVHKNDTVWVLADDGTLEIRDVGIVFTDADHAYIEQGLEEGERVVTSNLSTVADGAPLRLAPSSGSGNSAESEGEDSEDAP